MSVLDNTVHNVFVEVSRERAGCPHGTRIYKREHRVGTGVDAELRGEL